LETIPVSRMQ